MTTDFMSFISKQPIAGNKQPPAEGGAGVDAAAKWQDAISGRAPQFADLVDRNAAARSWLETINKVAPQAGVENSHDEAKRLAARGLSDRSGEWWTPLYGKPDSVAELRAEQERHLREARAIAAEKQMPERVRGIVGQFGGPDPRQNIRRIQRARAVKP